jgi:hypothetical protein
MEHSLFIMSIFIAALPIAGSGSVTTALIPSVRAGRPSLTESRLRISPPSSGSLLGGYFTTAPTPVLVIDPSDSRSLHLAEGEDEDGGYGSPQKHDGGASWNGIWISAVACSRDSMRW